MRLSASPTLIHQRVRLEKHLANSKSAKKRNLSPSNYSIKYVETESVFLEKFKDISVASKPKRNFKKERNITIKQPTNFCIYDNPEVIFRHIGNMISRMMVKSVHHVTVDYRKSKVFSLGSEVLVGLVASEITAARNQKGNKFTIDGILPKSQDYKDIISQVGIVKELGATVEYKAVERKPLIHVFKQDCSLNETASATADDLKNSTAVGLVNHIENALKDHSLKLEDEAMDQIKKCLGEVLDNVREHSGMTAPRWFVRGYINNQCQNKILELVIFNLGNSMSDNFQNLPDEHFAKKQAGKYVTLHSSAIPKSVLYTIAALQGRVSSKNENELDDRGQGTITLIEFFENFYREYKKLRQGGENPVSMNLISGSTLIKFDGKYSSKAMKNNEGGERVIVPFNQECDLKIIPDRSYVKEMSGVYFPGLMINIKIPLLGSTVPLSGR